MVWFIVIAAAILICGLIYLFLPLLKKMKNGKTAKTSEKSQIKKEIKADKKQQKADRKVERQLQKQEKDQEIISMSQHEDPDVKVEENNLDFDGFFSPDYSSEKQKFDERESLKSSYDDAFEGMFESDAHNSRNRNRERDSFYNIEDFASDNDLADFLNEDAFKSSNKDNMAKMIQDLPPEIKAIMLSDVLDKKDI